MDFGITIATAGKVISGVIAKVAPVVSTSVAAKKFWDSRVGVANLAKERAGLSRAFVFPKYGEYQVVLSHRHPDPLVRPTAQAGGISTYLNQAVALSGIWDISDQDPKIVTDPIRPAEGATAICIGSNYSHSISKEVLGDPGSIQFERQLLGRHIRLPYSIGTVSGESGMKPIWYSRHDDVTGGSRDYHPTKQGIVRNGGGMVQPRTDGEGKLVEDRLLFTRVPLGEEGQELIVLAGLYGPSIRAIRTLLTEIDLRDLEYAVDCWSEMRGTGMQAIFEVPQLEVDSRGDTVPRGIKLVRERGWEPKAIELVAKPVDPILWTPSDTLWV